MTDRDVRDMLRERASSITPAPDGFERIEAKLAGAPPVAATERRRRPVPMLAAAAALVVVALLGAFLVAQRDGETRVDSGPLATSPTSEAPGTASIELPLGVFPWPDDAVDESVFSDPGDTARAYVASRVLDVGATTEVGRTERDGAIVITFGGDVSTEVHLRRVDDRWYVESAASDLVTLHDAGDGTVTARVETAGVLTRTTVVSGSSDAASEQGDVVGGEEYPGLGYTLGRDDLVLRELFVLDTVDGTTAITEVAFGPLDTPPAVPDPPVEPVPDGVWPWPGDGAEEAWLADPRETALQYVAARFDGDLGQTTVSEFQQGDSTSGEVVFTGEVSTTVLVRRLDGAWHVEAAVTDGLDVSVRDDGETIDYELRTGGELVSGFQAPGAEPAVTPPQRLDAGRGASASAMAIGGELTVTRHWFVLTTDDGTSGLAEVRIDHAAAASEGNIPEDALFETGGDDPSAVAAAYLGDRLGGREVAVDDATVAGDRADVTWDAGVVILHRAGADGEWYVTEAIGDSVQIESATVEPGGGIRGELRLAQAGTARVSADGSSVEVRNDVDREGTLVPFAIETASTSTVLRVVFDTDTGFVSLAERVVSA